MKTTSPQSELHPAVQQAITRYLDTKQTLQGDVNKMEEIIADIGRCQHQKEEVETLSEQSGSQWRETFLKMRGQVSAEMKEQQLQRMANQEMSRELGHLLLTLDIEKDRQEITCSGSGKMLLESHENALMVYADNELKQALSTGLGALIRAMSLKRTALAYQQATVTLGGRLSDYEVNPDTVIFEEINKFLKGGMTRYAFDMAQEPVLTEIGIQRPQTKYFSAKLASGGGRSMAFAAVKRKEEQLSVTEK
ncbi:hypothetical protein QNM34_06070 [Rahnella bonaserana]|uniref:hypothetical protein n=1 Tax=Rahnella bonaserana TaxID=2816248 RepID=UPI0024C3B885|nr:hypothetical protein [Rahnella bonaserana]WHZ41841.1 hypothetical protein QNM34_06070 [Rahnella bonaserana]